jgi:hypothetical protein
MLYKWIINERFDKRIGYIRNNENKIPKDEHINKYNKIIFLRKMDDSVQIMENNESGIDIFNNFDVKNTDKIPEKECINMYNNLLLCREMDDINNNVFNDVYLVFDNDCIINRGIGIQSAPIFNNGNYAIADDNVPNLQTCPLSISGHSKDIVSFVPYFNDDLTGDEILYDNMFENVQEQDLLANLHSISEHCNDIELFAPFFNDDLRGDYEKLLNNIKNNTLSDKH